MVPDHVYKFQDIEEMFLSTYHSFLSGVTVCSSI